MSTSDLLNKVNVRFI